MHRAALINNEKRVDGGVDSFDGRGSEYAKEKRNKKHTHTRAHSKKRNRRKKRFDRDDGRLSERVLFVWVVGRSLSLPRSFVLLFFSFCLFFSFWLVGRGGLGEEGIERNGGHGERRRRQTDGVASEGERRLWSATAGVEWRRAAGCDPPPTPRRRRPASPRRRRTSVVREPPTTGVGVEVAAGRVATPAAAAWRPTVANERRRRLLDVADGPLAGTSSLMRRVQLTARPLCLHRHPPPPAPPSTDALLRLSIWLVRRKRRRVRPAPAHRHHEANYESLSLIAVHHSSATLARLVVAF